MSTGSHSGLSNVSNEAHEALLSTCELLQREAPWSEAHSTLRDATTRFQLWAGNINAFRGDRSSLQHRVRAAPQLQRLFTERLQDLCEDLADLKLAVSEIKSSDSKDNLTLLPSPSSEDDGSTTTSDDLALARAVNEDISALFELSALTRRSATRDHYMIAREKVDASAVKSEEQEQESVKDYYPNLKDIALRWLVSRLAKANHHRRLYLLYMERHMTQLGTYGTDLQVPSSFVSRPELPHDIDEIQSFIAGTTASTADPGRFQELERLTVNEHLTDDDDTVSQVSYVSHATTAVDGYTLKVKDLESIRTGNHPFICPYCFTELTITTQAMWEKHVYSDLRAYLCTVEGCEQRMFENSHDWLRHEVSYHHGAWSCPYCENSSSFTSVNTYRTHMEQDHPDMFHTDQLPQLEETSWHEPTIIKASTCKFCDWPSIIRSRDQGAPRDEDIFVTLPRYRKHVGHHLEQIALLVLSPEPSVNEDHTDDSSSDDDHARLDELTDDRKADPSSPSDIFIAVMGRVGFGKSPFTQLCTDEHDFGTGMRFAPEATLGVKLYKSNLHPDQSVWLIDKPGFRSSFVRAINDLEHLATELCYMYQDGQLLSGIVYVLPADWNDREQLHSIRLFRHVLGEKAFANLVLASDSDHFSISVTETMLKDFISEGMTPENGTQFMDYTPDKTSVKRVLDHLIGKNPITLDLQRQMVDEGRSLGQTNAGFEIAERITISRNWNQLRLDELESELREAREFATGARDPEQEKRLEKDIASHRKTIDNLSGLLDRLNSRPRTRIKWAATGSSSHQQPVVSSNAAPYTALAATVRGPRSKSPRRSLGKWMAEKLGISRRFSSPLHKEGLPTSYDD